MVEKVGVTIVGYGFMGSTHMVAWSLVPEARITAVVGRNVLKGRAYADKYGARAYGSLTEALKMEDVEVVDVCTPTHTHRELTVEAARAGKHVVVEKPMALTLGDADAMIAAAKEAGVKLMVAHVLRFFADYVKVKELVKQGVVGDPVSARAHRLSPAPPWGVEGWFLAQERSGGVVVDLAIHDVDFLRWCFEDEVQRVYAATTKRAGTRLDDHALIALRFRRAAIAHVEASWAMPQLYSFTTYLEVAGTKGVLNLDNQSTTPLTVTTKNRVDRFSPETRPWIPGMPFPIDPYYAELRHFTDCVLENKEPMTDGEESRKSLEVVLAAVKSAELGQPVNLAEV